MYWQKVNRVDKIAESMPVNRYFLLRNSLHVNAARQPPTGENCKFWKVKPVINAVRNRCIQLPREEFNAVDEQMIPFTGRVPAKQFVKGKPNPVGLKNFVICGKSGRAVDFEIYQAAGTGTKHLGLGASVVLRLVEAIPKQKNCKICFDNYFTGIPLIRELKSRGIHSLGVVKSNRLMGCELKSEKDLKKKGRGAIDYKVSDKGDICVVRWMDNGAVTLASSFADVDEEDQVRGWRASTKEHIIVERSKCVQVYNDNMGGVDKLDFLISLYRTKAKTKKWPVRVIFHFMDFALANSWLEYRDIERANGTPRSRIMDLLEYRSEVAFALLKANVFTTALVKSPSVGRPRSTSQQVQTEIQVPHLAKRRKSSERPVGDVRYDGFMHFPSCINGLGQRCKYEGCNGRSRVKCNKCNGFLCLTKEKNCFLSFHSK
uniref:piggyBac transposable element-derived protein 3-like n=1 Tax=Styela clava TaxID=7725 RepID=UPI00193955AB|nr:piggyBac transposable element-derived protein 3-like [Styela clava]